MPDLFETMESCRAMRRLKPDPVPDELIAKILRAGSCAPNGGNTQKWRFLVVKDRKIKEAVAVWYKKAFDEVIGPRYLTSEPPPGVTKERYLRQHAAVEYLTDHFAEAPVWIVACLEDGPTPNRMAGSSIYPAVQNMVLATRAVADVIVGDPSTEELARIGGSLDPIAFGGSSVGRGIREHRYLGKVKVLGQTELRGQFVDVTAFEQDLSFGGALFSDMAWIGADVVDFGGNPFRPLMTFGVSWRILWNRNFALRWDLAVSPHETAGPGFYIIVGQVF